MNSSRTFKKRPPRLQRVFAAGSQPLYFVTFNTLERRLILDRECIHEAFRRYGEQGLSLGAAIGRYVIMPDHIHTFVRLDPEITLERWGSGLKRVLGKALCATGESPLRIPGKSLQSFWQPGFFDHILRSNESYAQKWEYVRQNPVRAGLVRTADDWPLQGEIVQIDRA